MLKTLKSDATNLDGRSIRLYLLIAFGGAWLMFLLPVPFGLPGELIRGAVVLDAWSAAMWAPGIAALIANRYVDREPVSALGMSRMGDGRAYLWAWLAPPLLTLASGALTVLLGAGQLDTGLSLIRESLSKSGSVPIAPELIVGIQAVFGLTVGALFNILFALGEELGWRAYLLRKLLPLGQLRAIFLTGLIWGIWHWPAILQGHNYPGHPISGMFLMVGFCILFGAFLSWLYLRTRSVWAPALGHATLNAIAGFPILFIPKVDLAVGGPVSSLIGWIPLVALIGWLLWSHRLPAPEPEE